VAVVRLRNPLRQLAGGVGEHSLEGASVADVLRALEGAEPALRGWILDERGHVRRHINVFVNGEGGSLETPVSGSDRIDVLPAISGGA
jgi:molybdopterin synthase sulfur carrier subunit